MIYILSSSANIKCPGEIMCCIILASFQLSLCAFLFSDTFALTALTESMKYIKDRKYLITNKLKAYIMMIMLLSGPASFSCFFFYFLKIMFRYLLWTLVFSAVVCFFLCMLLKMEIICENTKRI